MCLLASTPKYRTCCPRCGTIWDDTSPPDICIYCEYEFQQSEDDEEIDNEDE